MKHIKQYLEHLRELDDKKKFGTFCEAIILAHICITIAFILVKQ